jgi:hypothetical protein
VGLLQMTILPGWVWIRAARLRTQNVCEEGLYCFAASLIFNHWLVYLLTAIGYNNRSAWLGIVAGEVTLLWFLIRPRTWPRFVPASHAEFPQETPSFTFVGLAALAVVTLLAFIPILRENWGTVFITNDDVASWDRWAQDWALNRFPVGTNLYPQLLTANWAVTYALMGTADVKMFAKAIMPFFAVATLILFISLAWSRKDRVYLAGCAIVGFLFLQYLGRDFLMTGYMDVALAFFCFLAFYPLHKEASEPSGEARILALFFATGAALTKQGGLLALATVALHFAATKRKSPREPGPRPALRWSSGLAIAFVMLWYIPKFYFAARGDSNLRFLLHDIHAGRNYLERVWFGCRLLIEAGGRPGVFLFAAGAALILGGLLFSETRRLSIGIVLPALLLWGAFFSYEVRTLALLFPFVAVVCCLTLKCIGDRTFGKRKVPVQWSGPMAWWTTAVLLLLSGLLLYYFGEPVPRIRINYTWPLILAGSCAAVAPFVQVIPRLRMDISLPALAAGLALVIGLAAWPRYRVDHLLEEQLSAQRRIGNAAVDARLYHLRDVGQLSAPVLSNYWYLYSLPELKPLARILNCDRCSVSALFQDIASTKDAGFLLLEGALLPSITVHSLEHCPGFETIFVEGTVSLFRVDRSRLRGACPLDSEMFKPVIEKLYPSETRAGVGFNVQSNGSAAIGVGCRNASRASVVVWAGTTLNSAYGGPDAVTAEVPSRLFAKPGHYPIEIFDKDTGLRSAAVDFEVKGSNAYPPPPPRP